MADERPAFYLSTAGEYRGLVAPRACWVKARATDGVNDQHMLVEIEPVLLGQPFGLGARDVSILVLSPFFKGTTLFPIERWPYQVRVARLLDEAVLKTKTIEAKQVEGIAWGSVFKTLAEAQAHVERLTGGQ